MLSARREGRRSAYAGVVRVATLTFMTDSTPTALEARIAALSDDELRHACLNAELEDPDAELLFGECERRNIDL